MTREDLYYLEPDPAPDTRCVHLVDGEECGEPTDGGPVCDWHPAATPEEYDAYAVQAA
ncbi:hypothetical protein NGM33_28705 [Nocardiopsis dassonvillei]|uniref:hypothetical protein n=1 Tax=Nocardiopsis dassonvillei TaxID=2014 RepID=UPI0020A4BB5A|nr:hypothetical protein [Nocardiopsis dassonvillei]MCP3017318.1 hypothetical protein [Nocardiopsis dassonvillei]